MSRQFGIYTLLFFISFCAKAQVYVPVTNTTGTQTFAGVNVTVTSGGSTLNYGGGPTCGYNPGYNVGITAPGYFSFAFSPHIKGIKIHMFGTETGEVLSIYINGSQYTITPSNITSLGGVCAAVPQQVASSGNITVVTPSTTADGTISILQPSYIDSIRIQHLNGINNGTSFDMTFLNPDTVVSILQPFTDTALCTGDTLRVRYAVSNPFKSNNVFTAFLSDPGGSFTNSTPTFLGSVNSDTDSIIKFQIPISIIPGAGYRVMVTASNPVRQSFDNAIDIKIGTLPVHPSLTSNSPACSGFALNLGALTSTSSVTYTWTGPNNYYSYSSNPTINNVSFAAAGKYYLSTSLYGCTVKDSITVAINQSPALLITATSNSPICTGDTLKLFSTNTLPGTAYSWTGPTTFPVQNPKDYNTSTSLSGKYTVKATLNGCIVSDTVIVNVKPLPAPPSPANNGPLCAKDSLKLTAGGVTNTVYHWTGPGGFNSNLQNPVAGINANSGRYYLTALLNGCTIKDSTTAVVYATPDKPIAGSNSPVCFGDTLKLTAADTSTSATYTWSGPPAYTAAVQNPLRAQTDFTSAGKYVVTASISGCSLSDTVSVIIYPIPDPVITPTVPICAGDTVKLRAKDTTTGVTLSWTGPNGFYSSAKDTNLLHSTTDFSGQYIISSRIGNCVTSDSTTVLVKPMPGIPVLSSNTPVCSGEALRLSGLQSTAGIVYSWTGPDSFTSADAEPIISNAPVTASGNYKLIVNLNGCKANNTTTVLVKPTPDPTPRSNSPVSIGKEIKFFIGNNLPGTTYQWEGPNSFLSFIQEPVVYKAMIVAGGIYKVTATLDGCTGSDTVLVTINEVADTGKLILYPSPNNGNFSIAGLLHRDQLISMQILDYRGELVYKDESETNNKILNKQISVPQLAGGDYFLRLIADGKLLSIKFTVIH